MEDCEQLYHVQDIDYANAINSDTVVLRVRVGKRGVSACQLHVAGGNGPVDMGRAYSTGRYDYYEAQIKLPASGISYCFTVTDEQGVLWFTKYGAYRKKTTHGWWSFVASEQDVFQTPPWVRDAVFYQIFVERFCNGDRSLDPAATVSWDQRPELDNFFGGDLPGVLDKLPYLKALGINAIYFNPIFEASTNHKYNTTDYYRVDRHFGDTTLLKKLVATCHKMGMRVILDGVFNHVGTDFFAFQDVMKNGKGSKYKDWFFIHEFPVKTHPRPNYVCWWDIWELPKLNCHHAEVRKYLLDVAEYWIRECDIDGWRLDVPEEMPHSFWVEFRKTVKSLRPDAYIVGEIWHDGRPWLRGNQFDAVMNYRFREAIMGLLGAQTRDAATHTDGRGDVKTYDRRVHELLADLPQQVVGVQFNLLGSHDTERLRTLLSGDVRQVKLAYTLLMTAPGAPVIYYGDEVGMEGGADPDCRRGFPWDERHQDRDLHAFVQRLIALRHQHSALRTGSYRTLHQDDVYAMERHDSHQRIVVVVNPHPKERQVAMPIDGAREVHQLLGTASFELQREHTLAGRLGPYEAAVLRVT